MCLHVYITFAKLIICYTIYTILYRHEAQLAIEQKRSRDLLRPLQLELADLEGQISDRANQIAAIKSAIYMNEEKLYDMYKSSTTVM